MKELLVQMYHYVRDRFETNSGIRGLTAEELEQQIRHLGEGFEFIGPEDIINYFTGERRRLPDRACLLTFDDGLKDHFKFVYPILKKYRISGIFFLITETFMEGSVSTVHKIHLLREKLGTDEFTNLVLGNLKEKYSFKDGFKFLETDASDNYRWDDKKIAALKKLLNYKLPYKILEPLIGEIFNRCFDSSIAKEFYLTKEEILEMDNGGMVMGSHTHTHRVLSRLNGSELEGEIRDSKRYIEELTGRRFIPFSFPYGKPEVYNSKVLSLIRECSYPCAFTTVVGVNRGRINPYTIKRIDPKDIYRDME
ncbi:MAG: polysaccharide deacetylase family protein [Nitrospirae bacterium]|nr:polysaccharide deacetylase family protein [Nitrospirota bacterium]